MADGGLTVFDGSLLREATVSADSLFSASGDGDPTTIDGAHLLSEAESVASSLLLGLSLPENLKAATLRRLGFDELSFRSLHFNRESASETLRKYVAAVADELRDDPFVVSVLDGSIIRMLLEDEDDFAMLAENLFTELDRDDTGKLCKSETRNALAQMGVEMGVPSPSVNAKSDDLLDDILRKHGAEGEELLGQAQFANLLQAVLQSLADALGLKPIVVIQDIKVINGSKIRQILANEELLLDTIDRIFDKQTASELDGGSIRKFRALLEKDGTEFGLPLAGSNEALVLLYDQVFGSLDIQNDEELDKEAFGSAVKQILQEILNQMESNPVFHEPEGN
ncbi:uncharacterized protein LOC116252525 isoform X2 [Nymphaea colorata]|uniref:uncharacterized protein LOC116252525 isoform X2 n=1 Tax=Nymphaea colorata TaxID=210225 RepID=UPI00129D4961|nr:uncharacterized protein LOC116252525 isoform X2 [Nymphaea colorata]